MPDDLASLAIDEGPGAFMPRPEHASPEALVRRQFQYGTGVVTEGEVQGAPSSEVAKSAHRDRKAKRKAARAARRRNRR
jgi:hypothetical protein